MKRWILRWLGLESVCSDIIAIMDKQLHLQYGDAPDFLDAKGEERKKITREEFYKGRFTFDDLRKGVWITLGENVSPEEVEKFKKMAKTLYGEDK